MLRFPHTVLVALLFACPVYSVGLPDTGQDTCYSNSAADAVSASNSTSMARDGGTYPRQDCRYGHDAAASAGAVVKIGAGSRGFDYSKIANNGTTLPAGATSGTGATDWACTKDNITGLTWENKTPADTDLRYAGHRYTWYNSDMTTNGGDPGSTGVTDYDSCNGTLPMNFCNTTRYIMAINAATLCSYTDWRLPTVRELLTLVDLGIGAPPFVSQVYFPFYYPNWLKAWSGSTDARTPAGAWVVLLYSGGGTFAGAKSYPNPVLSVRGAPF